MDSLLYSTKRKKRKTRKCLDELRKRSRRTGRIIFEKDSNKLCGDNDNKYLITNNRLTLRMFPKAVRSETITRPVLENLKQKSNLNLDILIKDTKVLRALTSTKVSKLPGFIDSNVEYLDEENLRFKVMSHNCTLEDSNNGEELDVINMKPQEKLSGNLDLLTSIDSKITDKSPDSIGAQSVSTVTSDQCFLNDYGYDLYEEFMSEIPNYLKINSHATFLENDFMKKTKIFLQNLYLENCYQQREDNLLKCVKTNNTRNIFCSTSERIVHNPMDYIRLGHVKQQNLLHQTSKIEEITDGSSSIPQSPIAAPSSSAASPDLSVIVHDTPDYAYYPHILN